MIIADANVLINAVNQDATTHTAARGWLHAALTGREAVAIPWVCALAFIRITTNARILDRPFTVTQALALTDSWLSQPLVVALEPGPRHRQLLRGLLESVGTAGNLTTDAHLAALAIEYAAPIATFDRDFGRYGVKIVIPS